MDWNEFTTKVIQGTAVGCEEIYPILYEHIDKVLGRYFSNVVGPSKDDLRQVALLKCIELMSPPKHIQFDPAKGNLQNYFFTGIRNTVGNFLYKTHRDVLVPEFFPEVDSTENTTPAASPEVSFDTSVVDISSFLTDIDPSYDKYTPSLANSLQDLGFSISGNIGSVFQSDLKFVERLLCLFIWRKVQAL